MQKIFWNWQDDDSTKHLNQRSLGIFEPGLYRGFDFDNSSTSTIKLNQLTTGFNVVLTDEPTYTVERRGVVLTKQGVVIHENDVVVLPFTANASGNPRIDICVLEHEYVDVPDGSAVIYNVITGTPSATPVAPSLTSPKIQTILGYLYVPAGVTAANTSGVVYTRATTPVFANDSNIALHQSDNNFTMMNIFLGIQGSVKNCRIEPTGNDGAGVYYFVLNLAGSYNDGDADYRVNNFILEAGYAGGLSGAENIRLRTISPDENLGGKEITIYTTQELRIDYGYDILPSDGGAEYCIIPPNSVFILKSVSNTLPLVDTNNKWILVNAQRASENRSNTFTELNNFTATVVNNSGNVTIGTDGVATGFTYRNGNTMIVSAMAGSGVGQTQVTGLPLLPEGSIITLEFTHASLSLDTYIIKHNAVAVSGTVLPILTKDNAELVIKKKGSVKLRSTSTGYVVVDTYNEKKYFDGYKVLDNSAFNTVDKTITITNDANNFSILVPTNDTLENIKVLDNFGVQQDVPAGTIINIRFKHIGGPIATTGIVLPLVSTPFRLSMETSGSSNIRSNINDYNFIGSGGKYLSIIDDEYYGKQGDVITFRKTDTLWEIISANREAYYARKLDERKVDKGIVWQDEASRLFASPMVRAELFYPSVRHCVNQNGLVIIEMNFLANANIAANSRLFEMLIEINRSSYRKSFPFTMLQNVGAGRNIGHMNFQASPNDLVVGDPSSGKALDIYNATAIPAGYTVQQTFIITQ